MGIGMLAAFPIGTLIGACTLYVLIKQWDADETVVPAVPSEGDDKPIEDGQSQT